MGVHGLGVHNVCVRYSCRIPSSGTASFISLFLFSFFSFLMFTRLVFVIRLCGCLEFIAIRALSLSSLQFAFIVVHSRAGGAISYAT
jgi:hypothetical protein